jgi:hypothetical protein
MGQKKNSKVERLRDPVGKKKPLRDMRPVYYPLRGFRG